MDVYSLIGPESSTHGFFNCLEVEASMAESSLEKLVPVNACSNFGGQFAIWIFGI